jgi:hypothetical protein
MANDNIAWVKWFVIKKLDKIMEIMEGVPITKTETIPDKITLFRDQSLNLTSKFFILYNVYVQFFVNWRY